MRKFYKLCLLYLLILLGLQSCKPAEPGIWKNEQIKPGKRQDFHTTNNRLLSALKAGDNHTVEDMMSAKMLDNVDKLQIIQIGNHLNSADYQLLEEYYVVHDNLNYQTIQSNFGINGYHLRYRPDTKEMYIGLFVPKSGENKYMITLAFGKYDYGWRVYGMDLQKYTLSGKTAPQLYELAKQQYTKGYLIDAINTMQLSAQCSLPTQIWLYNNQDAMSDFCGKIIEEGNVRYKFPIEVKQVTTRPLIFRISNEDRDDHYYPMIYYLTKISLSDTAAIKRENAAIKQVIGDALQGINKDKKYVLYCAFNELPSSKKYVKWFEMTDKL